MAASSPRIDTTIADVPRVIWEGVATGDTITPFILRQQYGLAASIQVVGTFGGATVTIQVSNDGTNWVTVRDMFAASISFLSAGYAEVTLSAAYIRPNVTGGTGDDLDIIMVLRGSHGV
jgi:hypothetical protein